MPNNGLSDKRKKRQQKFARQHPGWSPGEGGKGGGKDGKGGGGGKGGKQPFSALSPSFKTMGQFRKAIKRRTQGYIQSQLKPVKAATQEENLANRGRVGDIRKDYNYYTGQVRQAANQTQNALDELLATRGAGSAAAQNTLAATLAGIREGDRAQATTIGGTLPSSDNATNAILTGFGSAEAAQNALGQQFGAQSAFERGRVGTAGLARVRANEDEAARHRAIVLQLAKEMMAIKETRPAIREQMRQQIMQEELQRAAQRAQNQLANKQLGLQKDQLKEQKREANLQHQVDMSQVALQEKQIEADLAKAGGGGGGSGGGTGAAHQAVQKWKAANDWLDGYLSYTKPSNYDYTQVIHNLMSRFKLSRKGAIKVMMNGPKPMRKWAKNHSTPMGDPGAVGWWVDVFRGLFN